MNGNEQYMQRCFQLAEQGLGSTLSNPLVGCVIVNDNKIIAEGYHAKYGGDHAEPDALKKISDKELLKSSTLYVNLEPCSHHGKTPPCSNLIIQSGIKEVVICNTDPNPLVNGQGIKKLNEAGITTTVGILEKEGLFLNRRFFTFQTKKRPYIILKWAQSADGLIGKINERTAITNQYTNQLVHKWRSEEQAILVGYNTAITDNPKLNVRLVEGNDPLRIVIAKRNELPPSLHLLDKSIKTIIANCITDKEEENLIHKKFKEESLIEDLLQYLYEQKIASIIIEGGANTLNNFISKGLWDEARIITSDLKLNDGVAAPKLNSTPQKTEQVFNDTVTYHYKQ